MLLRRLLGACKQETVRDGTQEHLVADTDRTRGKNPRRQDHDGLAPDFAKLNLDHSRAMIFL